MNSPCKTLSSSLQSNFSPTNVHLIPLNLNQMMKKIPSLGTCTVTQHRKRGTCTSKGKLRKVKVIVSTFQVTMTMQLCDLGHVLSVLGSSVSSALQWI